MHVQMSDAAMNLYIIQGVHEVRIPFSGAVISSEVISRPGQISLQQRMPDLYVHAVIARVSTDTPIKWILWKAGYVQQTGACTQKTSLLNHRSQPAVELATRITKRHHGSANLVFQPRLAITYFGPSFLRSQES
jgi:hypothetical protein